MWEFFFAMIILAVVINVVAIYLYRQRWLRAEGTKRGSGRSVFRGLSRPGPDRCDPLVPLLYFEASSQ